MSSPEPLAPAAGRAAMHRRLRAWLPDVAAFAGALLISGLAALLLGSLPGCGGGVGSEGTGSFASSGSFASGTITGYGSIIVNGVHFDETSAQRQDDDGQALSSDQLALGMVVEVSGGPITTGADGTPRAVALTVRANRLLVGPVAAPDAAAGRLTVLGQTVLVTADTVFDESLAGWAGLTPGRVVTVYGFYDNTRSAYVATRLAPSASSASTGWRVSGPVAAVDAQSRSFTLGSQTYSTAALAGGAVPTAGTVVRLDIAASQPGDDGRWTPSSAQRSDGSAPQDREGAELDGLVSALPAATRFVVNGVTVDASAATLSGSLRLGAKVEVSGALRAGVLVASRVEVSGDGAKPFELSGSITSLDRQAQTFVLRGSTVSYARSDLRFDGGSAAQLVVNGQVKVEGVLSADRTRLEATRIQFGG